LLPILVGGSKINGAGSLLAQSCKYWVLVQNTHFLSVQKILGASPTNLITAHILIIPKRLQHSFMYILSPRSRKACIQLLSFSIRLPRPAVRDMVLCSFQSTFSQLQSQLSNFTFMPLVTRRPSFGECEKTSVSFALICNSPRQPNHNWTIGEAQHILLFSHTSKYQQINCSLEVDWLSSLGWQCYRSVHLSVPIFRNVKGALNESSKLETAVRPLES